jgi:hypothetical protein
MWTLLVFTACVAAFGGWAVYQSGRKLRDAMAEAAHDDPHWEMNDLCERRATLHDADNSAVALQAGHRLVGNNKYTPQQQALDDAIDDLPRYPAARANEQQNEALTGLLKPYAAAIVEYRKVKDMPNGRHPLTISPDVVSTLLPHAQHARGAARALRLDAFQRMEAGDAVGSADSIIAGFNAGRSIGDEPFLISGLVRIACDSIAIIACERFLAQVDADDATLARLQAIIELELRDPIFLNSIRGERGFGFAFLQYLKENPSKGSSLRLTTGPGSGMTTEEWLVYVPGMVARSQADILKHMNEAVRIARRPYEEYQGAYEAWDKKSKDLSFLARQFAPGVLGVYRAALRHQAQLRCMQVAFAAERYRLQNEKWPEKLDDLVTAKLIAAVPLDPFEAKPLRWKVVDDGRVIYSVGQDRTDNGGNIDHELMNKDGSDIGFRLYDPDKRRQPPRPPKPKEPAENPDPGSGPPG